MSKKKKKASKAKKKPEAAAKPSSPVTEESDRPLREMRTTPGRRGMPPIPRRSGGPPGQPAWLKRPPGGVTPEGAGPTWRSRPEADQPSPQAPPPRPPTPSMWETWRRAPAGPRAERPPLHTVIRMPRPIAPDVKKQTEARPEVRPGFERGARERTSWRDRGERGGRGFRRGPVSSRPSFTSKETDPEKLFDLPTLWKIVTDTLTRPDFKVTPGETVAIPLQKISDKPDPQARLAEVAAFFGISEEDLRRAGGGANAMKTLVQPVLSEVEAKLVLTSPPWITGDLLFHNIEDGKAFGLVYFQR